jgi:hypothetical protein
MFFQVNKIFFSCVIFLIIFLQGNLVFAFEKLPITDEEINTFQVPGISEYSTLNYNREKWTPVLVRIAETSEDIGNKTQALMWLCEYKDSSLLELYLFYFKKLIKKTSLENAEYAQLGYLLEALIYTKKDIDAEIIVGALELYLRENKIYKIHRRSPLVALNCWWGAAIAILFLGETNNPVYLDIITKIKIKVESTFRPLRESPPFNNRIKSDDMAITLFATNYASECLSGTSPLQALIKIFETTEHYLERVAAMNLIRELSENTIFKNKELTFPFRQKYEKNEYLDMRHNVLSNIGERDYKYDPTVVKLSNGKHPTGPLSKEEIENEISTIKNLVFPELEQHWDKQKERLKEKDGVSVLSILKKKLRRSYLFDDYRMLEPEMNGGMI